MAKDQRPVVCAACAGAIWPAIAILLNAATIVFMNETVQGQLYDEDGPIGFALKTTVLISIFSLSGFLLGLLPGAAVLAANASKLHMCKIWQTKAAADSSTNHVKLVE
ncbi:hypothetical protein [Mariniblastus fucicola]|uniref:hypothetical protein n=1 Tax=Mariniblastus fucicola TaxID=980251 RepID=UPI0009462E42|nr:hypothetical protein [Mariniblastus fucicola]